MVPHPSWQRSVYFRYFLEKGQHSLFKFFLLYFLKSPYPLLHCNTLDTEVIWLHLQKDGSLQLHTDLSLIMLTPHAACLRIQELQRRAYITCVWWNLTGTQWTCRQCIATSSKSYSSYLFTTSQQLCPYSVCLLHPLVT